MTDEPKHIATAAAETDPYAALNQHLHGDGDPAWRTRSLAAEAEVERLREALQEVIRINVRQQNGALYTDSVAGWSTAFDDAVDAIRAALAEGGPR